MTPLRSWSGPQRLLAALFVLGLCAGWAVALLNIHDKSTDSGRLPFSMVSVIDRYRGEGWTEGAAGEGAMSYSHLIDITHVHAFSIPMLLLLAGGLFTLTGASDPLKRWVLAASFADHWANMGSLWAIRYGPQPRLWAIVLMVSGILMTVGFVVMAFFTLRDLLCDRTEAK